MGKETEKSLKKLNEFLEQNKDKAQDETSLAKLVEEFYTSEMSQTPRGDARSPSSDDYLEMAEHASSRREALKYAKRALELNEYNIDAAVLVASIRNEEPDKRLEAFRQIEEKARKHLTEEGYFDKESVGDFWLIIETRPYMRLLREIEDALKDCGKMHAAAKTCEEMLRLCESDNLGMRYELLTLYAVLEDERAAQKLLKNMDSELDGQSLLPLMLLYYKLENEDMALFYLRKLLARNKDAKRFFKLLKEDALDELYDLRQPYGYRPDTIGELAEIYAAGLNLYETSLYFADWAHKACATKRSAHQQ